MNRQDVSAGKKSICTLHRGYTYILSIFIGNFFAGGLRYSGCVGNRRREGEGNNENWGRDSNIVSALG